jgi:hypothetical protein
MTTSDENKVAILAELWMDYRNDEDFIDFIEYNDLGLPLAYAIENEIAIGTDLSTSFINETFDLLLTALSVDSDIEYENLEHLLDEAGDEGLKEAE